MSFSVDWSPDSLDTLASIWVQAQDRSAVTAAEQEISRALARNPLADGKPVSEGLYAIAIHPLRVLFEVSEKERTVTVVSVARLF
jgi:mRNA-degrading endonuclease RelE of RelBE toxin-antitoxin system